MTEHTRVRILAIGMFDSVHFAGWLQHFQNTNHQFLLFPSSPHRRLHSGLKDLLGSELGAEYKLAPATRALGLVMWIMDKALSNRLRATFVRYLILKFRPDFVHALEMQNAGYVALKAIDWKATNSPKLIITNYGSDIYWFSRQPKHAKLITELLANADRYGAECNRDVKLALEMGFRGTVMPVFPNAGGFPRSLLQRPLHKTAKRNLIMIKGYHGWVGRAHIAIEAVEKMANELKNYEIVFFSCNWSTKRLAGRVAKRTGLDIKAYSKGALTHDSMLEKFSNALVYVGLSLSDGISTSMLEAMASGAVPVQTSTACCDEWFTDTGVAIEDLTPEAVAQGIQKAIQLAHTEDVRTINLETVRARASREKISRKALSFYGINTPLAS